MSMETTLRYETNVRKGSLIKILNRQKERIQRDDLVAARENTVRIEQQTSLKSDWDEASKHVNEARKMKTDKKTMEAELKLANTAFNAVRKAALRKLLEEEAEVYKKELGKMGKTFYVQRA